MLFKDGPDPDRLKYFRTHKVLVRHLHFDYSQYLQFKSYCMAVNSDHLCVCVCVLFFQTEDLIPDQGPKLWHFRDPDPAIIRPGSRTWLNYPYRHLTAAELCSQTAAAFASLLSHRRHPIRTTAMGWGGTSAALPVGTSRRPHTVRTTAERGEEATAGLVWSVGRQAAAPAAAVGIVTALATVCIFVIVIIVIVIVLGLKLHLYGIAFETKPIFACFPSKTK